VSLALREVIAEVVIVLRIRKNGGVMEQVLVKKRPKSKRLNFVFKVVKRVIPVALAAYFCPIFLLVFAAIGLIDVLRNRPFTLSLCYRYFLDKGVFTWVLAPFNLLMDLLSLPYWNKGIYQLSDLPAGYQAEIQTLIDASKARNLAGLIQDKMAGKKRGMIFFQWYGKILPTSMDIPEFTQRYKYIRTIGLSMFNKKQSTDRHFGPLRVTLRVLYNVNDITSPDTYIQVGDVVQRWRDKKLFIFDDTLEHASYNETDALRACLFVDIVRPSLFPWLMRGIVTCIRLLLAPIRRVFYNNWEMLK
jgi:aspartyl/asparaginyl beta-hydroxylase (cupin superfamily)